MIDFTHRKKLVTYDGNYDQFVKTKSEKEENQMKQYKWEQEQIKSMKEYIARFGHGTAKNAKQAQSKEKVLQKMVRGGLTEKPYEEKILNFKFPIRDICLRLCWPFTTSSLHTPTANRSIRM